MLDDFQRVVVADLVERHRLAQVAVLHVLGVVVQLAVAAHLMRVGVALLQPGAELALCQQIADLGDQGFGVAGEVLQDSHAGASARR
ncbi:hypothetical protein D3C80_2004810 [compost metagenome]